MVFNVHESHLEPCSLNSVLEDLSKYSWFEQPVFTFDIRNGEQLPTLPIVTLLTEEEKKKIVNNESPIFEEDDDDCDDDDDDGDDIPEVSTAKFLTTYAGVFGLVVLLFIVLSLICK